MRLPVLFYKTRFLLQNQVHWATSRGSWILLNLWMLPIFQCQKAQKEAKCSLVTHEFLALGLNGHLALTCYLVLSSGNKHLFHQVMSDTKSSLAEFMNIGRKVECGNISLIVLLHLSKVSSSFKNIQVI